MSANIPQPDPRHPQGDALAALRMQLESLYPLTDVEIPLSGGATSLVIARPANPDTPLDQLAAGQSASQRIRVDDSEAALAAVRSIASGERLPYWSLLWPSGIALAEALVAAPAQVRGARVLELGCGLGLTASAAQRAGAQVWAVDIFAEALLFCRYNTLRNTGAEAVPLMLDWRTPEGRAACVAAGKFDVVLGADVLYEQEDVAPLLELVPALLREGGAFWLAAPERRAAESFVVEAQARGWQDNATVDDRVWPEDSRVRVVTHRYTLPAR